MNTAAQNFFEFGGFRLDAREQLLLNQGETVSLTPKHSTCWSHSCEEMVFAQHVPRLRGGVNTARHEAYRHMLARGFRTDIQGVVMSRPKEAGYNRPGIYLIDDWR